MTFPQFIDEEVQYIRYDGCSFATNYGKSCCKIHDLEYYYGRSAISAYVAYRNGIYSYWKMASLITREESDKYFINCLKANSSLGYFSPVALIRKVFLKLFSSRAWNNHRKVRP